MVDPQVFGNRYELVREIARGGMAEVYLARDLKLNRVVAIKVLSAELSRDPTFVERFRLEAQAAANLNHPNIVAVYDWGQEQTTSFIVMEHIEGRTLRDLIHADGTIPPAQIADIGAEIAAALSFAHQAGVVHRDVKPGNVLITPSGQVKVTDFGIARANGSGDGLTRTGAVMGTATYFSPEQAQGLPVDGRADVYSLGIVLYEMATGAPPFTGDNPVTVAYQHVREPIPPMAARAAVPPELARIILTCLEKDPLARYQSADDLRADLLRYRRGQQVIGGPVTAAVAAVDATSAMAPTRAGGPVPPGGPTRDKTRRWPVAIVVALLIMVIAVIGWLIYGFLQNDSSTATVTVKNAVLLSEAQARARLEGQGLKVRIERKPNDQLAKGIVAAQRPEAGANVDEGSTVVLTVSDGKGSKKVEDVTGLALADAERAITAQGFVPKVQEESSDTVDQGLVLRTEPRAGKSVAVGSEVIIVVSAGPASVTVPNVVGQDQVAATQTLASQSFRVQKTTQPSSTVPVGTVISTNPAPGTEVRKGDSVTIVVSTGPEQVPVPNVVGQTQAGATGTLQALDFKVSVQTVASTPANAGKVIAQSPTGGSTAPKGSTVTITVGAPVATTTTTTTTGP
jgi:serine/threonine-protein kinase